jgi:hypothetical protein
MQPRDGTRLGSGRIVQPLKPGVAVGLKEAGEARHVRRRMLGTPVGAVEVGGGGSSRATEQPIVAYIDETVGKVGVLWDRPVVVAGSSG